MLKRLLSICRATVAEPAFHYKDRVKVVRGFYKGQRGEVRELNPYMNHGKYMVLLDGETFGKSFFEHELESEGTDG
jgi:hypothetical protein